MNDDQQLYGQENNTEVSPSDFLETPQYKQEEYNLAPEQESYQQQAPQEAQGQTDILNRLAEKGYDVSSFNNDEDLIAETEARFAAANQTMERLQQQAQQAQQPQQPEFIPNEEAPENSKPEFDQSWTNLVEPDETGKYVIRDEYVGSVDPSIAEKVNSYVEWRQERSNQLIEDPVSAVMESGLSDQIDARIKNAVDSHLNRNKVQEQAQQFIQQNADVLYVKNPQTGQVQVDQAGQPVLSPVGKSLNQAHVMLRNQGMYDPVARHQVAMQMVQNQVMQQQAAMQYQQPAQQQAPQSVSQSFKDQYTDQPFAQPTNPLPPGHMPNTPVQPTANALGANGLPEHNSLGSLATALAVHKGYLQQKGQRGDLIWLNLQQY